MRKQANKRWPGPSAEMCQGFLYKIWRILPEIFLEDFSGHFFPPKCGKKNGDKIREENVLLLHKRNMNHEAPISGVPLRPQACNVAEQHDGSQGAGRAQLGQSVRNKGTGAQRAMPFKPWHAEGGRSGIMAQHAKHASTSRVINKVGGVASQKELLGLSRFRRGNQEGLLDAQDMLSPSQGQKRKGMAQGWCAGLQH